MILEKQSNVIIMAPSYEEILDKIEYAARKCYMSDNSTSFEDQENFIRNRLISSGHHSTIEHASLTVEFITDRGITHELVRHRIASFSQSSTRYCNYSKEKFGSELTFIIPPIFYDILKPGRYEITDDSMWENLTTNEIIPHDIKIVGWLDTLRCSEYTYLSLIECGVTPQYARSVLPTCLKTNIVTTANLREWRHILALRSDPAAHPQIRELMVDLGNKLEFMYPAIFENIIKKD